MSRASIYTAEWQLWAHKYHIVSDMQFDDVKLENLSHGIKGPRIPIILKKAIVSLSIIVYKSV